MPIYVYEVILDDGEEGQVFEVRQKMSDPPLTHHPTTGQPVRRLITAPHTPRQWAEPHGRHRLGDKALQRGGFTRYEKTEDGAWERTAGDQGPRKVRRQTRPPR